MSIENPLLADLIAIPTEVHRSEFVVSLHDGLDRASALLDTYVVPPQVAGAFEQALTLVASAVDSGASRGAFLHASFGGGKSSLMAVLGLVLRGHPAARNKEGLADAVADFDRRAGGRRFLVVPVHMIGAPSMEAAVLGGYAATAAQLHPDAPLPAVHVTDGLFEAADRMRATMGDAAFFALLGERPGGRGWGKLAGAWDPAAYDAAVAVGAGSAERERLVATLVERLFPMLPELAQTSGGGYVPFKQGLSAASRHAQELGYDAIVLLLDELVLWLASRLADHDFAQREGVKIGVLTDAPLAERPVPIVSFVARQRDLRELVGEVMPGAAQLNVADQLSWWEGRFDVIELADRNLPAIVHGRLLRPTTAAASRIIDEAFAATTGKAGERVVDTLCTSDADRATFRLVYPFSPALISALVDLSNVLQRERTALRVLVQLLVDRRADLRVGELVALGDVYDVLAGGDEPFSSQEMKQHWASARRLYDDRLRPMLLDDHDLTVEQAEGLPPAHAFRADERLVKTLLLAALVPGSAVLRDLTVTRLAALNHGSIRTPIPGQEKAAVLGKLQRWQAHVGELQLSGETNDPIVRLRITGVDADAVIEKARGFDTYSERRGYLRRLLFEELGVVDGGGLFPSKQLLWRGSRRTVDVVFGNVANRQDTPDTALMADADTVRVVVDLPFDEHAGTAADDLARLAELRSSGVQTQTLVWLPQLLSKRMERELGTLVVCDKLLVGERFSTFASDLSEVDRQAAQLMVEGRAKALKENVRRALRMAYGLDNPVEGVVQTQLAVEDQWSSLDPTFAPRRPPAAGLGDAFDKVVGAYLAHLNPAHPEFEDEIRTPDLRAVLAEVQRAARDRLDRLEVAATPTRRLLRRVANPLQLGTMHEAHYVPGTFWKDHFDQRTAVDKPERLTVGVVRRWIDLPSRRGLLRPVQDLVILTWAATTDRVLRLNGAPVAGEIGKLADDYELHTDALPDAALWRAAGDRSAAITGVPAAPVPSAAGVAALVAAVKEFARQHREVCVKLDAELRVVLAQRGLGDQVDRARTASAARRLVESLAAADDGSVVGLLAEAEVPTTAQAIGASIRSAPAVTAALTSTNWGLLESAERLTDRFPAEAAALRRLVDAALSVDEFGDKLPPRLTQATNEATDLVRQVTSSPADPVVASSAPAGPIAARGTVTDAERARALETLEALRARIRDEGVRFSLTWTLEEPGA